MKMRYKWVRCCLNELYVIDHQIVKTRWHSVLIYCNDVVFNLCYPNNILGCSYNISIHSDNVLFHSDNQCCLNHFHNLLFCTYSVVHRVYNQLIYFDNILLCIYTVTCHSNNIIFRPYNILIHSYNILYRSYRSLYRSNSLLCHDNNMLHHFIKIKSYVFYFSYGGSQLPYCTFCELASVFCTHLCLYIIVCLGLSLGQPV